MGRQGKQYAQRHISSMCPALLYVKAVAAIQNREWCLWARQACWLSTLTIESGNLYLNSVSDIYYLCDSTPTRWGIPSRVFHAHLHLQLQWHSCEWIVMRAKWAIIGEWLKTGSGLNGTIILSRGHTHRLQYPQSRTVPSLSSPLSSLEAKLSLVWIAFWYDPEHDCWPSSCR